MTTIARLPKQGGTTEFQTEFQKGFRKIRADELDADLDILFNTWNSGFPGSLALLDGSVTAGKLEDNSVGYTKLVVGSIRGGGAPAGGNIAYKSIVGRVDIQDGSITGDNLEAGIITETFLADGSVTTPKLADGAVTRAKTDPNDLWLPPIPTMADVGSVLTVVTGPALAWAPGGSGSTSLWAEDSTFSFLKPVDFWNFGILLASGEALQWGDPNTGNTIRRTGIMADDNSLKLYSGSQAMMAFNVDASQALWSIDAVSGKMGIGPSYGTLPANERLEVGGGVRIGTALGTADGTLQYTGTKFQGRVSGAWVDIPGVTGADGSLGIQTIYTANAALTTAKQDSLINANAGTVMLTLPPFNVNLAGKVFRITRVDASTFQAWVSPASADTIDGVNTYITLAPNESVSLMACGTIANGRNWVRVADPTWRTIATGNIITPGDANKILVSQSAGNAIQWGARTVKARLGAGLVADASSSAYLSLNCPAPFNAGTDNTGEPSWLVRLQGTSDAFGVLRAPATSGTTPSFANLLTLDANGNLTMNPLDGVGGIISTAGYGNAFGSLINLKQCRGTQAAPTPSLSSDILGQLQGQGCFAAGANFAAQAFLRFVAQENWTNTARGTYFAVYTTPVGSTSASQNLIFDNQGNLAITGAVGQKSSGTTWSNPSDPRLKQDVAPYAKGLADICQLDPITYRLKAQPDGPLCYGFDAAKVQAIFPECVSTTRMKLDPSDEVETDEVLTFDIHPILVALVNAVKDLAARIPTT